MSDDPEIILPAGTHYVTVREIPELIALALYPEPASEQQVDFLRKVELTSAGMGNRTVELAPEDWEQLERIWREMPPFQAGMSASRWQPYAKAFDAAAVALPWRIVPFTKRGPFGTALLRASAQESHSGHLQRTIRRGGLLTYDHARLPNKPECAGFPDSRVRVGDFRAYAAQFGMKVHVMPHRYAGEGAAGPNWVVGELISEEALQSYAHHGYSGQSEAEKAHTLAQIQHGVQNDVTDLHRAGAILPVDSVSGLAMKLTDAVSLDWRLTREDVETFLRFCRFNMEGKRDFLLDRRRRQGEGRYTLNRAARLIEAGTGEQYRALLTRLVAAAEKGEIPTYAPGKHQQLRYGQKPGEESRVRDFYEEAYWSDLNAWLAKHEPRIRYRFSPPDIKADANSGPQRLTVQGLTEKLAAAAAEQHPEKWQHPTDSDPLRKTIVAAMNQHGWEPAGIPSMLTYVCWLIENEHIHAFSTFNDVPCTDPATVHAHPDSWYVTETDAAFAEAELARTAAQPSETVMSIEANYGVPPDWQQWAEVPRLTARQAVLLMHGLNPHKHPPQGPVPSPPRVRNSASMRALFDRVSHRIAVAEAEEADRRPAAKWLHWAMSRNWEVEEPFRAIARELPSAEPHAEAHANRPKLRSQVQEDEILRVIGELRYSPLALPRQRPGAKGVKAEVRERLNYSQKVFDKAWERLLSAGEKGIRYVPDTHSPKLG